jgi:hypothetical protein
MCYFLTADCFKAFCMMAGTEKGKQVRKYYLKIEKAWNDPYMTAMRAVHLGYDPAWFMREIDKALKDPASEYTIGGGRGRLLRLSAGLEAHKNKIEEETRTLKAQIKRLEAYAKENIERMTSAGISPREYD